MWGGGGVGADNGKDPRTIFLDLYFLKLPGADFFANMIEQTHIYRNLRTLIFKFLASTILKSETIFVKLTFRTNSFIFVNLVLKLIVTNKKLA